MSKKDLTVIAAAVGIVVVLANFGPTRSLVSGGNKFFSR